MNQTHETPKPLKITAITPPDAAKILASACGRRITVDQVRNAAAAVQERRQLDPAEARRHEEITREMWASLPLHYGWLREWEWV